MIRAKRSHLYSAAVTHPGVSGKNNEDRFAITAFKISKSDPTPVLFAIVADGVGGHRAGEVAAEIAVNTITESIAESDCSEPLKTLEHAIIKASNQIYQQAQKEPEQNGMGSTCVCALIIEDRLYTANVGDSRIYLLRNGNLQQLTTDHSWVQEAIEHGILTREQAHKHPRSNIIRRYLGSKKVVEPDFRLRLSGKEDTKQQYQNQGIRLKPGDKLLLCSDGLSDLVEDDTIRQVLIQEKYDKAPEKLVELANANGGTDNITAVVIQVPQNVSKDIKQYRFLKIGMTCLILLLLVSLLMGLGLGLYYYLNSRIGSNNEPGTPAYETMPIPLLAPETSTPLSPAISPPTVNLTQSIPTLAPSPTPQTMISGPTYTPWATSTAPPP